MPLKRFIIVIIPGCGKLKLLRILRNLLVMRLVHLILLVKCLVPLRIYFLKPLEEQVFDMVTKFLELFGALVKAGEVLYRAFRNLKDFFK